MRTLKLTQAESQDYISSHKTSMIEHPSEVTVEGTTYTRYCLKVSRGAGFRMVKLIIALAATLLTAFAALLSKTIRSKWSEFMTGKERVAILEEKDFKPDGKSFNLDSISDSLIQLKSILERAKADAGSIFLNDLLSKYRLKEDLFFNCLKAVSEIKQSEPKTIQLYSAIFSVLKKSPKFVSFWTTAERFKDEPFIKDFCRLSIIRCLEERQDVIIQVILKIAPALALPLLPIAPHQKGLSPLLDKLADDETDRLVAMSKQALERIYQRPATESVETLEKMSLDETRIFAATNPFHYDYDAYPNASSMTKRHLVQTLKALPGEKGGLFFLV